MMNKTFNITKEIVVNGVRVQLTFAPREDEQIAQRVRELLRSIYVKQAQVNAV